MTAFALLAVLLLGVVALALLPPLWRGQSGTRQASDRQAANLAILREQRDELARERAEGSLSAADYAAAEQELARRLLAEESPDDGKTLDQRPSRALAIALVVLLPLVALAGYGLWGNPRALDAANTQPAPKLSAGEVADLVEKLAQKMKAKPDDPRGWVMLARSYKAMGRYADAAEAYQKGESLVREHAELLADYAETLAVAGNSGLLGKPAELIAAAQKLEPDLPHVLFLAGALARERGQHAEAAALWEKLLPSVEAGSEIEAMLRAGIEESRAKLGKRPPK